MKTSFLAYLTILLLPVYFYGCKHEKTNQSFDAFLGEWYTIKGDVEAYSFLKDDSSYIFVGTQGMRPVVYGTWKINKDKFIITMDNGTSTEYSFTHFNDLRYSRVMGFIPESISIMWQASSCLPFLDTVMVAILQSSLVRTFEIKAMVPFTSFAVIIIVWERALKLALYPFTSDIFTTPPSLFLK